MPRLPALRTRVLKELARQLRFESPDAARRHLVRAEELAMQLLEEQGARGGGARSAPPDGYPEDWVVFRITGLRTDAAAAPDGGGSSIVVRDALLSDLPALIDRLSAAAKLPGPDMVGARAGKQQDRWLTVAELCARWNVSRKTLERYRRLGLVSRRVTVSPGREQSLYSERAVGAFENVRSARIALAGAFTRLDDGARDRVLRRARRYHDRLGWSLHRAAQRLAAREGRSVEAIRKLLHNHDAAADRPIFRATPPLDTESRAHLWRVASRGHNLLAAATALRKSRATVYRATQAVRAARLRALDLRGPIGPLFDRPDAAEVLLAHDSARTNLGSPGPRSVPGLLRAAAGIQPEPAALETARAAAYWFLIHRARQGLAALPRHGARVRSRDKAPKKVNAEDLGTLDTIETHLLWASRVKAEMVRSQLPLLVRTIESQTGRAAETIPAVALRDLVALALEGLIESVDRFDPFKGGRLAAPASLGVARAVSQWLRRGGSGLIGPATRAQPRIDPAQLGLEDFTLRVHPWQEHLEPPPVVRERLAQLDERSRRVLEIRFGWTPAGGPPRTLDEVARELGTTPTRIAAMQRRAMAQLAHPLEQRPTRRAGPKR